MPISLSVYSVDSRPQPSGPGRLKAPRNDPTLEELAETRMREVKLPPGLPLLTHDFAPVDRLIRLGTGRE